MDSILLVAVEESYQRVQAHLHLFYLDTLELLLSMSMSPIPGNPLKSKSPRPGIPGKGVTPGM
jgi:hypothetical protein